MNENECAMNEVHGQQNNSSGHEFCEPTGLRSQENHDSDDHGNHGNDDHVNHGGGDHGNHGGDDHGNHGGGDHGNHGGGDHGNHGGGDGPPVIKPPRAFGGHRFTRY